jgi:hypothetical protein
VKVGPLDPDRTAEFGQVNASANARTLVRLHAQMYPQVLVAALSKKQDVQRSQGLDFQEVCDYLNGLTLDNGDPAVPEGAEVVGANVRGERDRDQLLTYVVRYPSGRTAKWFAPYHEGVLPKSYDEGSERVHLHELREKGLVATAGSAAGERGTTRMASESGDIRLARENDELRQEKDRLEREGREERARLQRELDEARSGQAPAGEDDEAEEPAGDGGPNEPTVAEEPPFADYDDVKAAELVKRVKAEDTSVEDVQAILDYERTHQNRRGVVAAAEARLGAQGRP